MRMRRSIEVNEDFKMAAGGTSKGGYDYEFVAPPDKSLECPVCLLTLREPHMISCCGNEFCQRCIDRVQQDGKPCPLCNEPNFTTMLNKKLVREVNSLVVRCPQKELGCDWEGELRKVESHLNPAGSGVGVLSESKGCGYVVVECPYQCGVQLQRRLLQEHEMKVCPKRPVEVQIASLTQKVEMIAVEFERVTVENQQLKLELHDIKEAHKNVKQELNQVKHDSQLELNYLKEELKEVKIKNESLQTALNKQQKLCDELRKEQIPVKTDISKQALQNSKLGDLEKQCLLLQAHRIPLPIPPFYFTVPNISHCQKNNLVYWSKPFYSHPGGYKMAVDVYPNGFG